MNKKKTSLIAYPYFVSSALFIVMINGITINNALQTK